MKKIFSMFLLVMLLAVGTLASAAPSLADEQMAMKQMFAAVGGDWIDQTGHRPVNMSDGVSGDLFNGLRVTKATNVQGTSANGNATMLFLDKYSRHYFPLAWNTNSDGTKTFAITNDAGSVLQLVKKNGEIKHMDSINGVTLDTPIMQLVKTYGSPAKDLTPAETQQLCGVYAAALYWNDKWLVTFDSRTYTVDRIVILQGSNHAFDRSAFNCSTPLEKYAGAYGWSSVPTTASVVDLGNNEVMDFTQYPNAMILRLKDVK